MAQNEPKLAVRAALTFSQGGQRMEVALENLTDAPLTLRDNTLPSFQAWPWLNVEIDGQPATLHPHAAYAVDFKGKEKTIAAKGRLQLGVIGVGATTRPADRSFADIPTFFAQPGEHVVRISVKSGRVERNKLGPVQPATIKLHVRADVEPTTHVFKTVKDCKIHADVYRLPGDEVRPVLVWIHGGALITGHRGALNAQQRQRYLDAGFVIVAIDYRLAPETKLAAIIDDVRDAFRWVREQGPKLYRIDPKRLGVVGHSAGGYLTLMSGFAVEPRPRALVAFYGYGDITNEWYSKPDAFYRMRPLVTREEAYQAIGAAEVSEGKTSARGRFYLYCRQNGLWPREVVGHDPDKEPRQFDRFCPIRNVTKEYPPTLLLHGDNDTDVPHRQSVDMAAELKKHGVPHDFLTIKNGPHGFDGGKGMQDPRVREVFDHVLLFLKKHTN